jgi:hypothetical protein
VQAVDECNSTELTRRAHSSAAKLRDLGRALIHEHSHRAVALTYRVYGIVEVTPNPNGGLEENHFRGHFHMYSRPRSSRARRFIGLAGALAEMLLDYGELFDESEAFFELESSESFSTTDRALAANYTLDDVYDAVRHIRQHWPAILSSVEFEMRHYDADAVPS